MEGGARVALVRERLNHRPIEPVANARADERLAVEPLRGRSGRAVARTAVNVHEVHRAEQAVRIYGDGGNVPLELVIADPRGVYLDANASLCRMLGYSRDEMKGKHSADVVAPSEVQYIEPALSEIKTKSEYQREWRFRRKDGSNFNAEVIATTMQKDVPVATA